MSEHDNISVNDTDLAHFDDVYKDSEVDEDGFDTVPDGKYQVNVDRVELVRTTKGDPMLKWTMRILGPNFAGRNLWRYNVMASDENIRWLKRDLYACELRLTRISELPANLERLLDVRLEVTKRTKGEYESIYINKRIRTADDQDRSSSKTSEALSKF